MVHQLLIHSPFVRVLWGLTFVLFRVSWIILGIVCDGLFGWNSLLTGKKDKDEGLVDSSLFFFWTLRKMGNGFAFDNRTLFTQNLKLKLSFVSNLQLWAKKCMGRGLFLLTFLIFGWDLAEVRIVGLNLRWDCITLACVFFWKDILL